MNKDNAYIIAGRVLQIVISLVSVRIMTTLLASYEVGNYYLIFSVLSFFSLFLINPINVYINRNSHAWVDHGLLYNRLFNFNIYLTLVCLLSMPVLLVLKKTTGLFSGMPLQHVMIFIAVGLFLSTWNQLIIPTLNLLNHRVSFVVFSTLTLGLSLLCSIVFAQIFTGTAIAWLAGQATAQALVTLAAYRYFRRVVPGALDLAESRSVTSRRQVRTVLNFALPVYVTTLLMWTQNQSYRLIVEQRLGLEYLALIGLGLGIASNIAAAVEALMQQLYLPTFYREITNATSVERAQAWNSLAQLALPVYLSLAVFVSCLAPFIVQVLAHEKFAGAWLYVALGAWIELCRMTNGTFVLVAHAEMQTRNLVRSFLVGGVLAVVGVWIASGYPEARILVPGALLVGAVAATGVMYHDMRKLMPTKVGIRKIWQSLGLSLPFVLAIPFAGQARHFIVALLVLGLAGSYFLLIQYVLARHLLPQRGTS
jgi:O-antigen/teichoic acid export membrane protein